MNTSSRPAPLRYLQGYAPHLLAPVQAMAEQGDLSPLLARLHERYAQAHEVRTDRALYDYVTQLKARHLRSAEPLSKAAYDSRLQIVAQALGTHTAVSRVQGSRLKAKREIRIASLFKQAPAAFLRMIVRILGRHTGQKMI